MKFVGHVFVALGIVGLFSTYNFNAWAATDCVYAYSGKYCKTKNDHNKCPEGCYCPGEASGKKAVGSMTVTTYCGHKDQYPTMKDTLKSYGIEYCPYEFPYTFDKGNHSVGQCYGLINPNGAKNRDNALRYTNVTCSAGDYLPQKKAVTSKCKKNHYCKGGTYVTSLTHDSGIEKCPSGYPNSDEGAKKIEDCYKTVSGQKQYCVGSTVCSAGYYFNAENQQCEHCPVYNATMNIGYVCPGGETVTLPALSDKGKNRCPRWCRPNSNSTKCVDTSGNDCSEQPLLEVYHSATPADPEGFKTCERGTYYSAVLGDCADCPAGYYCNGGSYSTTTPGDKGKNDCLAGTYSGAGAWECTDCTNNQYSDHDNATSCQTCQNGTTANQQHTGCEGAGCTVTYVCNNNTSETNSVPTPSNSFSVLAPDFCTSNGQNFDYWEVSGSNTQVEAGGNHSCGGNSALILIAHWGNNSGASQDEGVYCQPHYYLPAGSTICASCLPGYYCPGNTSAPYTLNQTQNQGMIECPAGYYSEYVGADSCTQCEGTVINNRTACFTQGDPNTPVTCPAGKYLPANSGTCAVCLPGHYCPFANTYTPSSSDQGMTECDTGYYSSSFGMTSCLQCLNGTVNAGHTSCSSAPTNTIFVEAGKYLPQNSAVPAFCANDTHVYSTQFCPGGNFWPNQPYTQGVYNCLNGGTSNPARTNCTVSLTTADLTEGISGNGGCWLLDNDINAYKDCVFQGVPNPGVH